MKKKDKLNKKVVGRSDDLERMREKAKRLKSRAENPGGSGSEAKYDQLKVGRNERRVLPRVGHDQFYTESLIHFKVGPNQWVVRCIGDKFVDSKTGRPISGSKTPCPICKKFLKEQERINTSYDRNNEEGKIEWRKAKEAYCPRVRYYFNVLTPDGEVKTHSCGDQIMEQLLGYFFEDDSDVGDFTAIDSGRWLNFKRIGDSRNTKYKIFPGDPEPSIEEQWDEIKGMLTDLDAARGELRTADEITNIMKGISDKADEDDTSSEEVEEDENTDDDDDDVSDEDEEKPKKSIKSSKLSAKMEKLKKRSKS